MIYIFKKLCCLYLLLNISNGYDHVLDKSSVREGDRFSISCSFQIAKSGKNVSGDLKMLSISRLLSNGSYELIVECGLVAILKKGSFSRPWIFKGLSKCLENIPDFCISVEVPDAKCSDAIRYTCSALYHIMSEETYKDTNATEELKRDASCDQMAVSTPAGDHIKTPKMNSAHQETTPMRWQLFGAILVVGMLAN